jgi:hypothetical protein
VHAFLGRLADESRSVPATERCALVLLTDRLSLEPEDACIRSEVTLLTTWYWSRVARWDVAALLAAQPNPFPDHPILEDVRMEAVIEIARWNFGLALELWRDWSGDSSELPAILAGLSEAKVEPDQPRSPSLARPPETWMEYWDDGIAEVWHGSLGLGPTSGSSSESEADRLTWLAQARVLLPWIEGRRIKVHARVKHELGSERLAAVLADHASWANGPNGSTTDDLLLEVGDLARIVRARIGGGDRALNAAIQELWGARNNLAHLRPLTHVRLRALVQSCEFLG